MSAFEHWDDPVVAAIREGLGAIAIGEPAIYWIYAVSGGEWCVRREGDADHRHFASREEALAFARLSVVRCASYCLYLQGVDGRFRQRLFLGSSANPFAKNLSTPEFRTHMHP
ncbi:MAG TPA: hypothetical protein VLV76_16480 [Candidatus Acidoferrum sp.]|nr:hypothetical protein [Candidatus Acidoferrum sp.]